MSDVFTDLVARLMSSDSPLLPSLQLQQLWLHLGWGLVLAPLVVLLAGRWQPSPLQQRVVALAVTAWCWVPGPWGASFWLGLAFQAPSATSAGIGAVLLVRSFTRRPATLPHPATAPLYLPAFGVLIGWALLLDSFALLPVQLYALGFSPVVPVLATVVAGVVWCAARPHAAHGAEAIGLSVAVLVFVALRLPSGNAWDALLDPWLWLVLHAVCIQALRQRLASRRRPQGFAG
jgi:hypothetical protein